MHTAKLTRPGSAPMKALGHPERALAPLLLGNVRLGQHLLFGLEDEGENTQMFDLAPQAENAVVAEAGPSAGGRPLRVVAQTFGISISKASILSCGLASRMKAERDDEIRRLRAEGWTHRALAAHFELSRIRIIRICRQDDDAPVLHREPKQVGK